jgi:hypothetical protein
MNNRIVTSFSEYSAGSNPLNEKGEGSALIDPKIIENLVELVGSEEDVTKAAKESFQELKKAFDKEEIELKGGDGPLTLTMAALVIKLVEMGKLGPQDADKYIEDNLGDGIDGEASDDNDSKE